MVADAVIYHPSVAHYLRFVAQTQGRDKILRTFQYFSRFYAWYLFRTNHAASEIEPYENVKKTFGAARKLLRLTKWLEHLKAAAEASDNRSLDPVLRYTAVGRQLGYAGYLVLDNLTTVHATGIKTFSNVKTLQEQAYKAWFTGLLFSITSGVYKLYGLNARSANVNKEDAEKAVESKKIQKEWNAATLQLVQDVCDILAPMHALGYAKGLDDGIVGLAGTVSSLLGAWTIWKKTA